jgi:hypothetical protein
METILIIIAYYAFYFKIIAIKEIPFKKVKFKNYYPMCHWFKDFGVLSNRDVAKTLQIK